MQCLSDNLFKIIGVKIEYTLDFLLMHQVIIEQVFMILYT